MERGVSGLGILKQPSGAVAQELFPYVTPLFLGTLGTLGTTYTLGTLNTLDTPNTLVTLGTLGTLGSLHGDFAIDLDFAIGLSLNCTPALETKGIPGPNCTERAP